MADAKHAADDSGFRTSVLKNLGGGLTLVVLVSGLFWAIGMIGRADDELLASGSPEIAETPDATDAGSQTPGGTGSDEEPGPTPSGEPDTGGPDAAPDPAAEPEPEPAAPEPAAPEPAAPETEEPEPDSEEPEPDPQEPEPGTEEPEEGPEPETIPPGDITVQILDGYQADGGTAASEVADQLDGAGYQIIARNPALRYDATTVLWTAGNEEAGRQVAAAIGAAEAREQPGNLSDAVAVHVVVGADRG